MSDRHEHGEVHEGGLLDRLAFALDRVAESFCDFSGPAGASVQTGIHLRSERERDDDRGE